ncbi:ORF19 [Silurid herpesvirus 1]|nr:ORF19 [Silurid herpesvirus 1]
MASLTQVGLLCILTLMGCAAAGEIRWVSLPHVNLTCYGSENTTLQECMWVRFFLISTGFHMKNPTMKLGKKLDALPVVQVEAMPSFPVFIGSIGGLVVLIKLELIAFIHIIMGCLKLSRRCRKKEYQPQPIDPTAAQSYLDSLVQRYNGRSRDADPESIYTPLVNGSGPTLYGHTRGEAASIELNYIASPGPNGAPYDYPATKKGCNE